MASTITRDTWTDDTGTAANPNGDGTLIGNDELQDNIYDRIDQLLSGAGAYATLVLGANLQVDDTITVINSTNASEIRTHPGSGVSLKLRGRASDNRAFLQLMSNAGVNQAALSSGSDLLQFLLGTIPTLVQSLTSAGVTFHVNTVFETPASFNATADRNVVINTNAGNAIAIRIAGRASDDVALIDFTDNTQAVPQLAIQASPTVGLIQVPFGSEIHLDGGPVALSDTIAERGRTTPMGEWIAQTFNATDYQSSDALDAVTVSGGNVAANQYTLIGETIYWDLSVTGFSISGDGSTAYITVLIPGGFTAVSATHHERVAYAINNGSVVDVRAQVIDSTHIALARLDGSPWANGAANNAFHVSMTIRLA